MSYTESTEFKEKKQYVCSGKRAFSRGVFEQCAISSDGIVMSKNGVYVSEIIDSGDAGSWDKAELSFSLSENGYFRFTAFSSDSREKLGEDSENGISDDCDSVFYINPPKAPLSALSGRFMRFVIEAHPESNKQIVIKRVSVSFPSDSYIDLLPQVFQRLDNGIMRNMLDMYKTVTDEVDEKIVNIDRLLDPDLISGDDLRQLAQLQGVEAGMLWGDEKIRRLIKEANFINRMKGTKVALLKVFEVLLGNEPDLTESVENGRYEFQLLVNYSDIPSGRHYRELIKLMNKMKPAGVSGRLVLLKPTADLDKAYIGRNAVLSDSDGIMDDGSLILSDDSFDSGLII